MTKTGSIVGIVDSPASCRAASRLAPRAVDWLEWRADCVEGRMPDVSFPWILTARHPAEGGKGKLSVTQRKHLFLSLLPQVAAVDIELRSLRGLREVTHEASHGGKMLIISHHDFQQTPSQARLHDILHRAEDAGAGIIKIATTTTGADDVARLLGLFAQTTTPLALMGMGPLGLASRLLFARCGSVLNYGWLAAPNVSGQWSAAELKSILQRMEA